MFIAMNQFQVDPARGEEFEQIWRQRETYLEQVPGFVQFALLKGDEPGDYISHSVWESREAFLGWAQSEAFRKAHGERTPEGIVLGHPRARFYDSVLDQGAGATARG
jgi:heme-degrading monooxygenase HmoA